MVPSFSSGVVNAVSQERKGLQKVEVDGEPAYVLTDLIGPVAVGDRVVVNRTAVELGLGTGGWHFVHWNLSRAGWERTGGGHVLKLRYTSLQVDTGASEEGAVDLPAALGGMPVVACDVHSQLAAVAVAFAGCAPGRSLAYVMTDSAALPLPLSDLVDDLTRKGLLAATVTCGQAFGGEHEAVNVLSGLQVAASKGASAAVVAPGPGVVGTSTELGFTGVEVAGVVDSSSALGATPVVAVRYSDADGRDRHRGVSHHTTASLRLAHSRAIVPVPDGYDPALVGAWSGRHRVRRAAVGDIVAALDGHGIEVTTMGRHPVADPGFFQWAAAAGVVAAEIAAR